MDKKQELRTNLVLEAQSALNAVKELSDGLDKIARLKFDNVKDGFTSLTKAFEAAQKMSSKVAKVQTEDEKKLQNLLQERKKLISDMMEQFSRQKSGLTVKVDMSAAQKELQKTTRMVADMYDALGQTGKAKTLMGEALNVLTKLSNGGMKGIGLESAKKEYKDFERQLQNNKNLQKELDRQVANGIAEQHRQQAVKDGKDPFNDPVYAKSEAGKLAKKAAEEEARQAEEKRKNLREYVMGNINAQKAVDQARQQAHDNNKKRAKEESEQRQKDQQALEKHLREMQNKPNSSDSLNKMLGVNENVINSPNNKKKRKKQEEKARRLSESTDDNLREKNLQYDQKVRYALAKKQAQEEERQQREALRNEQSMAAEREKALRYEQQVRSAIAKAEYQESQRQARLEERQAQNLRKLQDRVADFQRKVDFEKRPGNVMSEKGLFALEQELIKIKRMADGIGATDISAKLTRSMLDGINVITKAQKEKDKAAKQADKEQEKRLKEQAKLIEDIARLYKDIQQHKGKDGLGYSQAGYIGTLNRIEKLRNRAYDTGLTGDAALLNPGLLQGVNTKVSQFNTRMSEAKDKAQELYMRFRETRTEADRLNFLKAKNDLRELENLAEDFNKSISKAARHDLTIGNIAKRAREHFNWTAGAFVENKIIEFPQNLIEDVSKYELAMAGVAQVLPKAEQGQAALNEQFRGFADTAAKYGQNLDGVIEAAKSIGRMYGQGDGNADVGALNTQILTQQAAKMATVDNFDMLEATRGLESALSQFNLQTEDSNLLMQRSGHILDVWTKLAHSSGASAQDLTQGVSKAGAAAKNAGVSFEMLNALIAVGVRSTAENGNIIGNSLKSMFSSILSDKNIKNMEQFGIQIYKIGKKGTKELRPMKDIILDISKALSENPKNVDTKGLREFMMPISGGKQQYSRVMAILGNYKELQRTMNLADDANGFTNKQLELQLDTISRKFETLKANVAQLFVNSGADGLANDLKWILDCLNRLTHALANSDSHFYKWAKYGTMALIAWKAIPAFINMATKAVARFNVAKQAGNVSDAVGAGFFGGISTNYQAEVDRQKKKRLKSAGFDMTALADSAKMAEAFDVLANKAKKARNPVNLVNKGVKGTSSAIKSLSSSILGIVPNFLSWIVNLGKTARTLGAGASAARLFAGAIGLVNGALSLLGGPLGIALTALTLIGGYMVSQSVDADLAAEKTKELADEVNNLTVEVGNEMEEMAENKEKAQELAEKYNGLVDKLKELKEADDGSTESAQRQNEVREEMKGISSELAELLHTNADQFNEDAKINEETIENLAAADHEAAIKKIEDAQAKLNMEQYATQQALLAAKTRIDQAKVEMHSVSGLSAAYKGFYIVISSIKAAWAGVQKMLAAGLGKGSFTGDIVRAIFGENVVNGWESALREGANTTWDDVVIRAKRVASGVNLLEEDTLIEETRKAEELSKRAEEISNQYNSLHALKTGQGYSPEKGFYKREKINPTKENPNEGTTATEPKPPKGKKGKDRSGSGHTKKEDYLYDDEESKSFSKASKHINQSYSDKGVSVPLLQAVANALNGGNFKGVADPFHNGAKNTWDSSYNFAEQLKKEFQREEDLQSALENIFKGWGISWKNVIDNASELDKKYNYKKRDKYFKDPTESGKTTGGGDNLGYFDSLMNDSKFGHMANAWVGLNQCVVSSLKASALVSSWAADMSRKGYAHVDRLYEEAVNDHRVEVKKYSDAEAKTGDIVLYVDGNGERQHAGVIAGRDANGKVINYDDSSRAGYKFIRRGTHDLGSSRIPAYLIHDKSSVVGGGKPVSRWQDGGDGLSGFALNPVTELLGDVEEHSEKTKSKRKQWEIEEKLTGDIARISKEVTANMEDTLFYSEAVNGMWESYRDSLKAKIEKYLDGHPAVAEKAGGKKNFFKISDTAKQELAKAAKDKTFEQDVKNFITAQKNFHKSSDELLEESYKLRREHGFMTASEKYDLKSHKIDRQLDVEGLSWEDKLPLLQSKYNLAVAEMARIDKGYTAMAIDNQKEIDEAKAVLAEAELERKEVIAAYDAEMAKVTTTDEKKKAKELEAINKKKERDIKALDDVIKQKQNEISDRANGTADMRDLDEQREKMQDTIKALKKEIETTAQAFKKAGADVSVDFFDKLLLQGKALKDCLKDIVDEIAKIALKNLIYSAFGVKKQPLEEQGDIGMLLSGIGRKRKNGQVPMSTATAVANVARPFEGMGFGRSIWGRNPFPAFTAPKNQWGWQGAQQTFSLLQQPLQQATQGMTALTSGLGTATSTMGVLNTTTSVLNTTQIVGRTATTLDTAAKHSEKLSVDQNTAALRSATSAYQAGSSVGGKGGGGLSVAGLAGSLFSFFRDGGKIPAYATGGYTNGLIRGAGTGTSDSILTYLAHRGQFIQTSNGEYIIKKSSVDKLGVGFLDMLNSNPESIGALNGLKRYASGGNLGESYSPSMSIKGVEAYKTFNKSNMEKQQYFSTRKMEGLLQGLRDDVQDGNRNSGAVTQPVILNTQADSASVMKAIAKNPRALQAILGKQQKRGFR